MKFIYAIILFVATACTATTSQKQPEVVTTTTTLAPVTTTTLAKPVEKVGAPLSWESDKAPHRKEWSKFLAKQLDVNFMVFDGAKDATRFCPKYAKLDQDQKITMWAEALVWVMYYESGWKPTSWMKEDLGIDAVTKVQVKSEGLLQLSYGDTLWAKTCKFDWSKDKLLKQDDPKKTIFDPYLNMQCGIDILVRQIKRKGSVILPSGVYWAVLKDGGKFGKVEKITAKTKALPFCN